MTSLDAALTSPAVAGPTSDAPGRRCKVRRVIDAAPAATAARIVHLLHLPADDPDEPGWTDSALTRAIEQGGHRVAASMLSRHRTRSCICTHHDPEAAR